MYIAGDRLFVAERKEEMPKRGLSPKLLHDLKSGRLKPILDSVKQDSTLCLEIRDDYFNVYYRGGSLLRIENWRKSPTARVFDEKYVAEADRDFVRHLPGPAIETEDEAAHWIAAIPRLKHAMDLWFGKRRKDEREYQQLIVRDNNFGKAATSTDYFICDMEYPYRKARFDMVAVKWRSTTAARKRSDGVGLALIELKCGDGSIRGSAGLRKHVTDMSEFLADRAHVDKLKDELLTVFQQKHELGLIPTRNCVTSFSDDKPEYIFMLANHDPESDILRQELDSISPKDCPGAQLKVATSCFAGYGLWEQAAYDLDDFKQRFRDLIHCK